MLSNTLIQLKTIPLTFASPDSSGLSSQVFTLKRELFGNFILASFKEFLHDYFSLFAVSR